MPTESELEYMQQLDQDLSSEGFQQHMGGSETSLDSVEDSVPEDSSGQRTIHMDYSNSEGMTIIVPPDGQ